MRIINIRRDYYKLSRQPTKFIPYRITILNRFYNSHHLYRGETLIKVKARIMNDEGSLEL